MTKKVLGSWPQRAKPQSLAATDIQASVWFMNRCWQPHVSQFIFSPQLRQQFLSPHLRRGCHSGVTGRGRWLGAKQPLSFREKRRTSSEKIMNKKYAYRGS
jgi:hypothetical protein